MCGAAQAWASAIGGMRAGCLSTPTATRSRPASQSTARRLPLPEASAACLRRPPCSWQGPCLRVHLTLAVLSMGHAALHFTHAGRAALELGLKILVGKLRNEARVEARVKAEPWDAGMHDGSYDCLVCFESCEHSPSHGVCAGLGGGGWVLERSGVASVMRARVCAVLCQSARLSRAGGPATRCSSARRAGRTRTCKPQAGFHATLLRHTARPVSWAQPPLMMRRSCCWCCLHAGTTWHARPPHSRQFVRSATRRWARGAVLPSPPLRV